MRMIPTLRARLADESGFSMLAVMLAMIAATTFVIGGFAAANGDLPMSRNSQDRKATYAAAEAGLNFYQYHLNSDNDYWTKCTNVAKPNATEDSPVNQRWNDPQTGTDPRKWRNVAGSTAEYTIELLPAKGKTQCVEGDQSSMIDPATGTFRIRVTGAPKDPQVSSLRRSINATFRRRSFLDFLYFTDYETLDPAAYDPTKSPSPGWAALNCENKRSKRPDDCTEIQFADFDQINGPFHTNDESILVCDSPDFGRSAADKIEVSGTGTGYVKACGSGVPNFKGPLRTGVQELTMPTTNAGLKDVADTDYVFTGTTTIRFNGVGDTMTVTNAAKYPSGPTTVPYPPKGVIFVKNSTTTCASSNPPITARYDEPVGCAQLYVSGTYTKSLTLASENDIIIRPPDNSSNGDLKRDGDVVMGLIANNYVRVAHRVNRSTSPCSNVNSTQFPLMSNVTIEAAILSLKHSFIVDNWACGAKLGALTVTGAIAQKFRGPVGTGGQAATGTGFQKIYNYDDRLRYRSPPYFLDPVASAWSVVRSNEQVPSTR
jgi:Tfp pilus assembly protein PilX